MKTPARGFTLIELLVVIAIIGILSSVILTSLNSARAKANDSRRFSDLREVQKALENYASSNNGVYPSTGSAWNTQCTYAGMTTVTSASALIPGLVASGAISAIPVDPDMNAGAGTCCYAYKSNGTDYKFIAGLSCGSTNYANATEASLLDPARSSSIKNWAVYTPAVQTAW